MNQQKKKGQGMVEYIALTALVAIVCIGGVKVLGGRVKSRLSQITNTFDRNIKQGLKRSSSIEDAEDEGEDAPPIPRSHRPNGIPGIFNFLGK